MSDKFTIDELTWLVELCGYDAVPSVTTKGLVWIQIDDERGKFEAWWNPAEDANQRDEVVEALIRDSDVVVIASDAGYECSIWTNKHKHRVHGLRTPGEAVCRAALHTRGNDG